MLKPALTLPPGLRIKSVSRLNTGATTGFITSGDGLYLPGTERCAVSSQAPSEDGAVFYI